MNTNITLGSGAIKEFVEALTKPFDNRINYLERHLADIYRIHDDTQAKHEHVMKRVVDIFSQFDRMKMADADSAINDMVDQLHRLSDWCKDELGLKSVMAYAEENTWGTKVKADGDD